MTGETQDLALRLEQSTISCSQGMQVIQGLEHLTLWGAPPAPSTAPNFALYSCLFSHAGSLPWF